MRIRIGQVLTSGRQRLGPDRITAWARLTGDQNHLHDGPLAVVPGLLAASLFPALIAARFPGALYLKQSLAFRRPIRPDQDITANVTIIDVRVARRHVRCLTETVFDDGTIAIDGQAEFIAPDPIAFDASPDREQ